MQLLLVEDEASIADTLLYALKTEGFEVRWCTLATEALDAVREGSFAMMIVDVGLPDMTGFELCKRIRERSDIPLMFLTARGHEIDRVVGLEIGADDYVTKPFSPREVCARVRTILRRARPRTAGSTGRFEVDAGAGRIRYNGHMLQLTRYEHLLLKTLLERPEQIFSRDQLMDRVWTDADAFDRTVDTHIKTLRAKLREVDASWDPIVTHRGQGYSARLAP